MATIRSEWTKTFTLPSVWIMTGVLFVVFFYFQSMSFGFYSETVAHLIAGEIAEAEAVDSLQGDLMASIINPGILMAFFGPIVAGAEFRAGQSGMSVVAVPDRTRLVASKVIVAALFALGVWLTWYVIGAALMLLSANEVGAAVLFNGGFFSRFFRVLLFMVSLTLFPLGLTLVARRTLIGVVTSMVFLTLTLSQVVAMVSPTVDSLLPVSAARNLVLRYDETPVPTSSGPVHGALVLIAWTVVTCVVAAVVTKRRDAS